jgi:nitrogen-specific signal transduction histidine kinase
VTLLLQGASSTSDYIWRALTASSVHFGLLACVKLITLIQHKNRYPVKRYFLIYLAGVAVTLIFRFLNVDVNLMVLPSLIGATYPMFETGYYEFFVDKEKPSFITKCFIGSGIFYSLHMLDYAYAFDKPEILIIGFFIACCCIFSFMTFSTASVIESIMYENAYFKMQMQYKVMLTNSSKLASLGEMAGGMAHEINNPLAVIQLQSDLLKRSLEGKDLDRMNAISESLSRISKVITNLRHFSRDTSKDPIVPYSVKDVVDQTLSFCRSRFADQGIQIQIEEFTDFEILCRPIQLSQAILNLLNNSFESLEKSDVLNKLIRIEVEKTATMGKIRVIDNGQGVPSVISDRIFDPFFTTKEIGHGMGLGLSVSLGMIEAQNGTLALDSNQSHTCFTISLPVA